MAIVASDMALYTKYMSKSETPVAISRTFQANMDTINTHGGCASRHPELVKEYVNRLMAERGLDHDIDVDKIKRYWQTQNDSRVTSILRVFSF